MCTCLVFTNEDKKDIDCVHWPWTTFDTHTHMYENESSNIDRSNYVLVHLTVLWQWSSLEKQVSWDKTHAVINTFVDHINHDDKNRCLFDFRSPEGTYIEAKEKKRKEKKNDVFFLFERATAGGLSLLLI